MSYKSFIYLDNNGTTQQCKKSIDACNYWAHNCANASTNNILAQPSIKLIEDSKKYIAKHSNIDINDYNIIYTSGGTESNCYIIKSLVCSSIKKPHVIISSIEHNSIIECCMQLYNYNKMELTMIEPNSEGIISSIDVKNAIKSNTILISIMYANNELGTINPIMEIGQIAKRYNVPFHSDCVQVFGKYKIDLDKFNLFAISASFHKLYGPVGIGLLIIKKSVINKYKLKALITGTQQSNLRGGTMPVTLIAGSIEAVKDTFINRNKKNKNLLQLKQYIINTLRKYLQIQYYPEHIIKSKITKDVGIVIFSSKNHCIENTLLISILVKSIKFCNINLKKYLESRGVIVSIGSACNTLKTNASHVITSLHTPPLLRRGILRISLGDHNTITQLDKFINILLSGINDQVNITSYLTNYKLNKYNKITL